MAAKTGPVKGVRIPVKLPWKGATDNKEQFVSIKKPVAEFLKFDTADRKDLEYQVKIDKKDSEGKKVKGKTNVTRRRRPGYRQRSVKVDFDLGKKGNGKGQKVGNKNRKSISFPITPSVAIAEVVEYFETGKGKDLKVVKVTDMTTGQGYAII